MIIQSVQKILSKQQLQRLFNFETGMSFENDALFKGSFLTPF